MGSSGTRRQRTRRRARRTASDGSSADADPHARYPHRPSTPSPNSRTAFAVVARAASSSLTPYSSATARNDTLRFAGTLRTPGSGPSTGLSVSSSSADSGSARTSFCFWRERTTDGGTEK